VTSRVVAPHTERKHYAFPLWVAATQGYDRLLAIEYSEADYAKEIEQKYGVPCTLFEPEEHPRRGGRHRICGPVYNQAWEAILSASSDHTYLLCLDTDVIPYGDILKVMQEAHTGGFLRHGVPWRSTYQRPGFKAYETSCTFATRKLWREALDKTYQRGELATLYGTVGDPDLFPHQDIDIMALEHLDDSEVDVERTRQ